MVIIERTHDFIQARVIVSFLNAHGVHAQLLDVEAYTMIPLAPLGVRIAVPDDEENQARRLLRDLPDHGHCDDTIDDDETMSDNSATEHPANENADNETPSNEHDE